MSLSLSDKVNVYASEYEGGGGEEGNTNALHIFEYQKSEMQVINIVILQ